MKLRVGNKKFKNGKFGTTDTVFFRNLEKTAYYIILKIQWICDRFEFDVDITEKLLVIN